MQRRPHLEIWPLSLCAPIAGPLVDRLPRRRMLIPSDLGAALATAALLALLLVGRLAIWHLCAASAIRDS